MRATRRQIGRTGGMKMKANNKRFLVYNLTDGVPAFPGLMTLDEARRFVRDFPRRFDGQGYYLTGSRQRIRPEEVELEIVDTSDDAPQDLLSELRAIHVGW